MLRSYGLNVLLLGIPEFQERRTEQTWNGRRDFSGEGEKLQKRQIIWLFSIPIFPGKSTIETTLTHPQAHFGQLSWSFWRQKAKQQYFLLTASIGIGLLDYLPQSHIVFVGHVVNITPLVTNIPWFIHFEVYRQEPNLHI